MTRWIPLLARIQAPFRVICALNFIGVGLLHFTHTPVFEGMMPPYLPAHTELVLISGGFEILGGVGLLVPFARRFSAWGLLALLIAVFPANVHMAMEGIFLPIDGLPQSQLGLWIRLPFQAVIALEVWYVGLWTPPGEPEA